jgi:fatty-acyl-CoA synthase
MHTGDLAVMDEDGYLRIVGRIKDMVIRGGENISPREIEEFLYGLPEISEVEVIGVPSERYGEELMAWVKLRDGATATADDLIAACRDRIAGTRSPGYWRFTESLPRTVTGKTQKFRLREMARRELAIA